MELILTVFKKMVLYYSQYIGHIYTLVSGCPSHTGLMPTEASPKTVLLFGNYEGREKVGTVIKWTSGYELFSHPTLGMREVNTLEAIGCVNCAVIIIIYLMHSQPLFFWCNFFKSNWSNSLYLFPLYLKIIILQDDVL